MTAAPVQQLYPTQSTRHHTARAYRDLSDWLASLRLKGRADRTLDDYERTIAALIEWKDLDAGDYTLDDLVHFVLLKYGATPGARVRMSHLKGFFTFATRLIQRGARIENVQLLLGHSSIQTTVNLYAHLDVEDARADLSLLELQV